MDFIKGLFSPARKQSVWSKDAHRPDVASGQPRHRHRPRARPRAGRRTTLGMGSLTNASIGTDAIAVATYKPKARKIAAQSTALCTAHGGRRAIKRFTGHRWDGNTIEIKVEWVKGRPTWEPEVSLHTDAPDELFAFWRSQGGHPTNPNDADLYEVHSIKDHSPNRKKLLVTWAGFDPADATWEPCTALEKSAGDAVADYWRDVQVKARINERRKNGRRQNKPTH